jgi:hypothetical protein
MGTAPKTSAAIGCSCAPKASVSPAPAGCAELLARPTQSFRRRAIRASGPRETADIRPGPACRRSEGRSRGPAFRANQTWRSNKRGRRKLRKWQDRRCPADARVGRWSAASLLCCRCQMGSRSVSSLHFKQWQGRCLKWSELMDHHSVLDMPLKLSETIRSSTFIPDELRAH